MAAAELAFIVKAIDDASGTLKGVGGELDNMHGKASKLGGLLKGAFAVGAGVAVAGIGALGVVLGSSVKEAMAAEETHAQLLAVLKSTGGAAGRSAEQIEELALGLSKTTRYEDDAIVGAESLLLTFTKISGDVFPKATALTLDLATAFKMDLKSAAMMVGKALNDPVKGLTAMGRAGVTFTQSQKDMIKAMVEAGDVAGAQRLIMAELETQVGGSARAAGETMAGQMDILKNTLGNVKEEIGGALIPILKDLVAWAGPRLVAGFEKFSAWIRGGLGDIRQLAGTLGKAKDIIGGIVDDVQSGKKINWQDLMNLAGLFTNEVDVKRAFGNIVKGIENGITDLKTAFDTGGIGGVFDLIWKSIGDFWTTTGAPFAAELGGKIQTWWTGTFLPALKAIDWASIGAAMTSAWDTLKDWWITDAVPFATEVATNISTWFTTQVIPALQTHAPEWGAAFTKMLKAMITINGQMLGEDANLAYTLGAGFVKLLISSLKALSIGPQLVLAALKSAFEGGLGKDANWGEIFGNIFGPIKDFLLGALDALLLSMLGDAQAKISAWWAQVWASITGALGGLGGSGGSGAGGGGGSGRTMQRTGNTGGRVMAGANAGMNVVININAPGGNPRAVANAAQNGVLQAARSLGIA